MLPVSRASNKAGNCHYWRLGFWYFCWYCFIQLFAILGDYCWTGGYDLVCIFVFLKVRYIGYKKKVRDKHQNNVLCIQFIFIIKGSDPTIVNGVFLISFLFSGTVTSPSIKWWSRELLFLETKILMLLFHHFNEFPYY